VIDFSPGASGYLMLTVPLMLYVSVSARRITSQAVC